MSDEQEEKRLIPAEIQNKIIAEIKEIVSGSATITVIESPEQYGNAVELRNAIKKLSNDYENERDKLVRPKNQEVKQINEWFKLPAARLDKIDSELSILILAYKKAAEQKRIEAQRLADDIARKEREKADAAAAEQRRKEAEALRLEDEARERARNAQNEEDRAKAQAEADKAAKQAEAAGVKAAIKEQVSESVVAVVVQPEIQKMKGASVFVTYSAEEVNKIDAIKYCVETGKFHLLILDMKTIGKMVVAEKENFKMPGIRVIKRESIR